MKHYDFYINGKFVKSYKTIRGAANALTKEQIKENRPVQVVSVDNVNDRKYFIYPSQKTYCK